ncbi:PREDICTED: charged multivesicular body protein 6 [Dufourea novaeangliae]|uniref:Charged multivesicular body protein 6 n=2 Tax=Apocrita TaxID=7400 RepID=A0A154P6S2_DUFNO|nr:PREDICTED: charged multivesicular body protein 6 [Dufourea novaeangliae]KZC07523.1 Charged multivesicular body protein 6 [Dufourea novaeangliae]
MGIFFAKKKPPSRVTEQDKAVLQLKQTRDKIKQYQRKIEQTLEKDRLLAKKLIQNGRKDRALLLLRKKKFQEQLLFKTDGQLENLERMVHDIEFAQVELKVVDGLKVGNVALKKLHDLLSIDEIEKVMDETKEGIEKQKEIDDVLVGALTDEDESEVAAELDALIAAEVDEKTPEVPGDITLPEIPEELPEKKKERTKEKMPEAIALEA